jgi:protein-disulfide isomerase
VKYTIKITIIAASILMFAAQPLWAASTKEEVQELQEVVADLIDGQEAMQKDLAEIKKLLQQGARPGAQAAPTFQPKDVTIDGAPVLGDANATVTVMEFSDYQCPFCSRHHRDVMPTLVTDYVETGKLKYVMRENPILSIHNRAMPASQAALCANDQGKYWEMHNLLFENQRELSDENLKSYAATTGLDTAAFNACLDEGKQKARVDADLAVARSVGVRGTPGFVLGLTDPADPNKANMTVFINGAQSLDNFKSAIDGLLEPAE